MKNKILIPLLLILTVACKKDPPKSFCEQNPEYCVDIRGVKDYFYFKHGSYWVYEEENSGLRDSLFVIETYSDPDTYYFTTTLLSGHDDYKYQFWTASAIPSAVDGDNMVPTYERATSVTRSKAKAGDFVAEDKCFLFYPRPGFFAYNYGGANTTQDSLVVKDVYPEFSLDTETFTDVVLMTERYTAIENLQRTNHYYAKGVGLIKKELIDSNQIWNLVNYHIEK